MNERDENIIRGVIVSSLLDSNEKERLCAAFKQDSDDATPKLLFVGLYRCVVCGTRWLAWPDLNDGGTWNLLDKHQKPGACCNNAAMREQIEWLRDIPLTALYRAAYSCGHSASGSVPLPQACPICDTSVGAQDQAAHAQAPAATAPHVWQPIESAPKGGGAERVDDPAWVEPPLILVSCPELRLKQRVQLVVSWDWYYAKGNNGYRSGKSAWVDPVSGSPVCSEYGEPTHWMPLPDPPAAAPPSAPPSQEPNT